jgi:hypothetical protein
MTIRESEHVTVTEAQICLLIAAACGTEKVIETAVRGQETGYCMWLCALSCITGRVHAFFGAN